MDKFKIVFCSGVLAWLALVFVYVVIWGGLIWIAIHFILKYW